MYRIKPWIGHPAQCIESCRSVTGVAYASFKTGDGDPECHCSSADFSFEPCTSKGWQPKMPNGCDKPWRYNVNTSELHKYLQTSLIAGV